MLSIPECYTSYAVIYHSYPKEQRLVSVRNLCVICMARKTTSAIHITTLIQTLVQGLILEKVHRVVKFNQKAWLKPCVYMNTVLKKTPKMTLRRTSPS